MRDIGSASSKKDDRILLAGDIHEYKDTLIGTYLLGRGTQIKSQERNNFI
jgi:hypothetical protein